MLRLLGMIAGWAAATAAVVALGWAAVGAVAGAVADPPALARPPALPVATGEPARGDAETGRPATPVTPDATEPPPHDGFATHTFDMAGGRIGVRASAGAAELLFATPREGFTVDVRARGPARVDVRFTSGSHESRFRYEPGAGERLEERPD